MAGVTKREIPEISNFMTDYWNLVKKHWIPEDDQKYWEDLTHECSELVKKYHNDSFVLDTLVMFANHQQRKAGRKGV